MARRIFRESALARYNDRLEKIELPRYANAPWILLAWLAALLMLFFTALLLAARLPVYAGGPGIVTEGLARGDETSGAVVVALLPAEFAPQLLPGQSAEITLPAAFGLEAGDTFRGMVIDVEPGPLSPAAARERFAIEGGAGGLINGPVSIARVAVDLPAAHWLGSVGEVRIEVGSRSALSLLPGLVAGETGVAQDAGGE